MDINYIIDFFYKIINLCDKLKLVTIDLKVIAIKELNIKIQKIDFSEDVYNAFDDAFLLLKNHGIIFNYEKVEGGFKIYPEDKIYLNENDLIVKFNEK